MLAGYGSPGNAQSEDNYIDIELFVLSPCESCREGEKFAEIVRKAFRDSGQTDTGTYRSYNVFREEDRHYMEKCLQELGMDVSIPDDVPAAIMDGKVYFGDYDTIARQLVGTVDPGNETESEENTDGNLSVEIEDEAQNILNELEKTDTDFLLFTTESCKSCENVKVWIKNQLSGVSVSVREQSITEPAGLELLNEMIRYFKVPDLEQQVPVLFYRGGYLSGEKEICEGIQSLLEQRPFSGKWTEIRTEQLGEESLFHKQPWWEVLITGFVNGLNPCGMSMLLMVLSILMNMKSGFLRGGLSYLAGKFLAYILMGTGVFYLFSAVETSGLLRLEQGITAVFAVLAFLIGILNFVDFWNVKRKEYGKVIVQLPSALRKQNHQWIGKLKQVPSGLLIPFLFGLGMVISLGEFFCTGQLYAASVLYMVRVQSRITAETVLWLLLYVSAMCLPLLILILVIQKSRNLLAVSRLTLDGMPVIKLINGVLFLLLSCMLAFSL